MEEHVTQLDHRVVRPALSKTDQLAFAAYLVNRFGESGQAPNRTQLHKAAYFLESIAGVPHGFPFRLYLHGPYSRELDSALGELQAIGWLQEERDQTGYGARYFATEVAREQLPRYAERFRRFDPAIRSVGDEVLHRGVTDLELLSTAWHVSREQPSATVDEKVARLKELKPHFTEERIREGFAMTEQLAERICVPAR
jgi:uncharacterized protein YwgA